MEPLVPGTAAPVAATAPALPKTPPSKEGGFAAGAAGIGGELVKKRAQMAMGKEVRGETVSLDLKEKIFFLDSFGSLVNAGIPIVRALQIIYFQSRNNRLRSISLFLKKEIETGSNMAKTAAKLPKIFSPFDLAMFEMGEATWQLGKVLETVVEREEKSLELVRKVKQALIYPVVIVFIACAMVAVIMTVVIPKIEKVYREANANLPAATQFVIDMSRFLRGYGIFVLAALALAATVVPFALRNPKIRYHFDQHVLKIPIFGQLLRKKVLVSYCEFLSSLLLWGIVINRALLIVKSGLGNAYYEKELDSMLEDVKTGKTLSSSMGGEYTERKILGEKIPTAEEAAYLRKIECFPIELSTAVKVGEQTGTLAKMLDKAAGRYNKEIDSLVKNLSSMLEPLVIVLIGAVVGGIVIAIMMPFFNMVNVVG